MSQILSHRQIQCRNEGGKHLPTPQSSGSERRSVWIYFHIAVYFSNATDQMYAEPSANSITATAEINSRPDDRHKPDFR